MSKFKVGDKVRVVISDEDFGLYRGYVHTVVDVHKMGNIELMGIDVIQWSPDRFELVQESTTTIQATAKREDDDLFTPDCLVGVETNYGYITTVLSVSFGSTEYFNPYLYVYTTESLSKEDLIDVHTLKYYISDESDETVSFTDYVNMFYDGWYNENEIKS